MSWGQLEGWLRWSAHPFGGAVCREHAQDPAFTPGSSELAVGFSVFLYLVVHNLPQLHMHAVLFCFVFLIIYLLLAALGLHCCAGACSSCGEQRLLFTVVLGFLTVVAPLVAEHRL